MSKKWTSPVYVFFKNMPRIEYKNDRRCHIFECAASHCKGRNGRNVCRYLEWPTIGRFLREGVEFRSLTIYHGPSLLTSGGFGVRRPVKEQRNHPHCVLSAGQADT